MTIPPGHGPGTACTCPAKQGLCNLDACQQPWAQAYRDSVQPKWYERLVGTIVAFLMGKG